MQTKKAELEKMSKILGGKSLLWWVAGIITASTSMVCAHKAGEYELAKEATKRLADELTDE